MACLGREGGRKRGVVGQGSSIPASTDAPLATTPPQLRAGAVEPPDTPVTLGPKRASLARRADEEVHWEVEAGNWRLEAVKGG